MARVEAEMPRAGADKTRAKVDTLKARRVIPAADVAIARHRGITRGAWADIARVWRCTSSASRDIPRVVADSRAGRSVIAKARRCNQNRDGDNPPANGCNPEVDVDNRKAGRGKPAGVLDIAICDTNISRVDGGNHGERVSPRADALVVIDEDVVHTRFEFLAPGRTAAYDDDRGCSGSIGSVRARSASSSRTATGEGVTRYLPLAPVR
jgi:hypothetical protein